jgi:hypothetical protein
MNNPQKTMSRAVPCCITIALLVQAARTGAGGIPPEGRTPRFVNLFIFYVNISIGHPAGKVNPKFLRPGGKCHKKFIVTF